MKKQMHCYSRQQEQGKRYAYYAEQCLGFKAFIKRRKPKRKSFTYQGHMLNFNKFQNSYKKQALGQPCLYLVQEIIFV